MFSLVSKAEMLLVCLAVVAGSACASGTPSSPDTPGTASSPLASSSFTGDWVGDGITFTVSNAGKVTTITLSYALNGCQISRTLSGLSLDVGPISDQFLLPRFDYGNSALLQQSNAVAIQGLWAPVGFFSGTTQFFDYMNCGSGSFSWSARRR